MGERIKILTIGDINPPHNGHEDVIKSCVKKIGGDKRVDIDVRISKKSLKYLLPWDVRENY